MVTNLYQAIAQNGDPLLPVVIVARELIVVILTASVSVAPGYLWENVSANILEALLAAFGFDNRQLGQDLWLSQVYALIQGVDGVDYATVESFGGLQGGGGGAVPTYGEINTQVQKIAGGPPADRVVANLAQFDAKSGPTPAQIAVMTPGVPDTIILVEKTT